MSLENTFESAFRLFIHLLRYGVITRDDTEMLTLWRSREVRDVLQSIMQPHAEVRIFEAEQCVYMIPQPDSTLFGHTAEEVRQAMKLDNNKQLYTAYFIMLCLISMFYNGEEAVATRQFVPVEELEQFVTSALEQVQQSSDDEVRTAEEETGLTLRAIAETWESLDTYNPDLKVVRRSKNRVSFILRVTRFFEEAGYVQVGGSLLEVLEDAEIRLLQKMKDTVMYDFCREERKREILERLRSSTLVGVS